MEREFNFALAGAKHVNTTRTSARLASNANVAPELNLMIYSRWECAPVETRLQGLSNQTETGDLLN